jgi:probable HAF family extracellular repeat protein
MTNTSTPIRRAFLTHLAGAIVSIGLLGPAGVQAAKTITVTDMGELSPGLGSFAEASNNAGRVVGHAISQLDFQNHEVIWDKGVIRDLGTCCGVGLPVLRSVNLAGEFVGDYKATKVNRIPVYWSAAGVSAELPALGPYSFGTARAINNAGRIVGSSLDAVEDVHAVIWDRTSQVMHLGFMGEPAPGFRRFCEARGINATDVVVGQGLVGNDYHAFQWANGSYTDLGLGGATHINDNGLVAGFAPGFIPVTWTQGVRKNLPALDGGKIAYGHQVNALNNAGDLVGFAPAPGAGVFTIAVLWRKGKIINLGHYPGGNNSYATGINDKGEIVGSGNLEPGGMHHALRWTVKGGKVAVALD